MRKRTCLCITMCARVRVSLCVYTWMCAHMCLCVQACMFVSQKPMFGAPCYDIKATTLCISAFKDDGNLPSYAEAIHVLPDL